MSGTPWYRLILCSASPARLSTLRSAGLSPDVVVSGVDESSVRADHPADLARTLAAAKAQAVHAELPTSGPDEARILIGCDSVLELDHQAYGKPQDPEVARQRWRLMRGRSGVLHSGHHVVVCGARCPGDCVRMTEVASTTVRFATLTDAEIDAYVATGEPLAVAGAFTIDGLGGPFVEGIDGDPHNVVGISLPLVRRMLASVGIAWPDLWPG